MMRIIIDKDDVADARKVVLAQATKIPHETYCELLRLCNRMERVAPATFTIGKDRSK